MEENMNKLDNLMTMTDKQIQDWLRKIGAETDMNTLSIALLGATDDIKECIFSNMSMHAKNIVNKSIQEQSKNGVKESEIQKNINIIGNLM
jgi:flagellar motor switch protein FliG